MSLNTRTHFRFSRLLAMLVFAILVVNAKPVLAQSFQGLTPDMALDEAGEKLVSLGFENAGRQAAPRGLERTTYRGSATTVFSSNIIEILHSGDDILAIRNLLDLTRERTTRLADMREALFRLGGTSTTRFEGRGWEMSVYRGSNSEPDCATYPATLTNRNVALDYGAAWVGRGPHCTDGSITFVAFDADRRGQPVRFVATVLYDFGDGLPSTFEHSPTTGEWQMRRNITSLNPGLAYSAIPAANGFLFGVGCGDRLDADSAPDVVIAARRDVDNSGMRARVFGDIRDLDEDGRPRHMPSILVEGRTTSHSFSHTLDMTGGGGLVADGLIGGRLFDTASFAVLEQIVLSDLREASEVRISIAGQTFDIPAQNSSGAIGALPCLDNVRAASTSAATRTSYDAYSTTAMGVTGALTIEGRSFTFAEGQTILADLIARFDLNGQMARLYRISMYKPRLAQELCGDRPQYLSMVVRDNAVLSLAFYEDDPRAASGRLRGACAVYNYSAS